MSNVVKHGPRIGIEIEIPLKYRNGSYVSAGDIDEICWDLMDKRASLGIELLSCDTEDRFGKLPARIEFKPSRPITLDELDIFLKDLIKAIDYLESQGYRLEKEPGKFIGSIHVTIDKGLLSNETLYSLLIKALNTVIIACTGNPMKYAKGSIRPLTFRTLSPNIVVTVNGMPLRLHLISLMQVLSMAEHIKDENVKKKRYKFIWRELI